MYVRMALRHQREVGGSWEPPTAAGKKRMTQVVDMWNNATNQGHIVAQLSLGNINHRGEGVVQDYKEALKWYLQAANQGLAQAQFELG